ncbi:MAG: alpha/beta fold hydrolase [Deltaproteobacteria bacterium]|nr:alpha/beta fold hydrolase [Candidatus Anaeroferrophillacea bacterium]
MATPTKQFPIISSRQGIRIVYAGAVVERALGVVLLINGRDESLVKYLSVIGELNRAGFSVYTYDHRGQGFSGRLLPEPHKGHVDDFADYVADLRYFCDHIVRPRSSGKILGLAHSLGGTIALQYALTYPREFAGLVLAAPMLGFPTAPWPAFLVPPLLALLDFCGCERNYIIGGGPFIPEPFTENNPLSSDRESYTAYQRLLAEQPLLQLGSPTNAWVRESLRALKKIEAEAPALELPILLLQPGDERVVDNRAQRRFCRRAGDCRLVEFPGSRHEILMEKPAIKVSALHAVIDFFRALCR